MKIKKGLRSTSCCYKNNHRDVKYSTGNIVNIVITMYGVRWVN